MPAWAAEKAAGGAAIERRRDEPGLQRVVADERPSPPELGEVGR